MNKHVTASIERGGGLGALSANKVRSAVQYCCADEKPGYNDSWQIYLVNVPQGTSACCFLIARSWSACDPQARRSDDLYVRWQELQRRDGSRHTPSLQIWYASDAWILDSVFLTHFQVCITWRWKFQWWAHRATSTKVTIRRMACISSLTSHQKDWRWTSNRGLLIRNAPDALVYYSVLHII